MAFFCMQTQQLRSTNCTVCVVSNSHYILIWIFLCTSNLFSFSCYKFFMCVCISVILLLNNLISQVRFFGMGCLPIKLMFLMFVHHVYPFED